MSKGFKLTGAALIAVVLMASGPAMARPRGGWGHHGGGYHGGGYHGWHRRGGGVDGGDVLLGAAIVGGIALLANEASKSNERGGEYDDRYRGYGSDPRDERSSADRGEEDRVAELCADAVERQAGTQVDSVDVVQPDGQGWRVEGAVGNQGFLCGAREGRVDFVQLRDELAVR